MTAASQGIVVAPGPSPHHSLSHADFLQRQVDLQFAQFRAMASSLPNQQRQSSRRRPSSHQTSNSSHHLQAATSSHASLSPESRVSSRPSLPADLGLRSPSAPPHTDVTEATSGNFRLSQEGTFEKWSLVASDFHDTTTSPWNQQYSHQLGSVSASSFHNNLHQSFLPRQSDARSNQEPPLLTFSQPQAASASPLAGYDHNYYHISSSSQHLSPQMSPYMAHTMVDNVEETMQAPVSPVSAHNSPHDTTMGDQQQQVARKRSHSVMSQQHDPTGPTEENTEPSRAPSIHSQTGATEEFSPRGSRAFKRGDPPTNEQGKYICDFADECWGMIFDRKCEWSKHMDKHDRPYRCPHPSCAKLQGFTYSGGLLRHEREVHNKHGGPKSQLVCPFTDCKRHSGKGFTRKENLNEHLRRVHQGRDTVSQQDSVLQQNGNDVSPAANDGDTQMSQMSTAAGEELSQLEPKFKRKRSMPPQPQDDYGAQHTAETAEQQVVRLRAENALQADRIRQLEAAAAISADRIQRLEETMSLWAAQQNGQSHVQHEQPQQELVQQQEEQQHYAQQSIVEHELSEQQQVSEQPHQQEEQQYSEQPYSEQPLVEQLQHYAAPAEEQHIPEQHIRTNTMEDVKAALAAQEAQEV